MSGTALRTSRLRKLQVCIRVSLQGDIISLERLLSRAREICGFVLAHQPRVFPSSSSTFPISPRWDPAHRPEDSTDRS